MSTFSVTRAANGQVVISLKQVEKYSVDGVGTMSGNMSFSLSNTSDGTDETVLQVAQNSDFGNLEFEADKTKDNFQFNGKNIDAKFNEKSATPYSVEWNANNSTFDSTGSKSAVIFEAGKSSYSNLIKIGESVTDIGSFDNLIFDSGVNNTYVASGASATKFESTADSMGAIVKAGNGKNEFLVGGKLGIFAGGSDVDAFITDKDAVANIMLGNDGADILKDYAIHSLFLGGSGVDTAYIFGKDGIANLGFDEVGQAYLGNGSSHNVVFTGETQTDEDGNTYDYKDIMEIRGWTLENYLDNPLIKNNPYFSLIAKEVAETLE